MLLESITPPLIRQTIAAFHARLRLSKYVKWQLSVYLWFMRIYFIVRQRYEQNNHKFDSWATRSQLAQRWRRRRRHRRGVDSSGPSGYAGAVEEYTEECRRFPHVHAAFFVYEHLSACYLVISLIKYAMPQTSTRLFVWLSSFLITIDHTLPAHCYLPGRLLMHESVRNELAGMFAFMNLVFRFISRTLNRPLAFSYVDFLLQDVNNLKAYWRHSKAPLAQSISTSRVPDRYKWHPYNRFMCFAVLRNHQRGDQQRQASANCCDQVEYFKLKANRTPEAYSMLTNRTATATLMVSSVFLVLLLWATPAVIYVMLLDKGYLYQYPHCNPLMEQLNNRGQLSWFSFTFTWHRLYAFLFDAFDNFFIYLDSALALTYALAFPYLLDVDLKYYWAQLYDRIVVQAQTRTSTRKFARYVYDEQRQNIILESSWSARQDAELHELKCELSDFFVQLRETDMLVSDFISIGFVFWLASVTIIMNRGIRYYLEHPNFLLEMGIPLQFQTFVAIGIAIGSVPISYLSITLFQLYTQCLRGYLQLCTLIANSHSNPVARERFASNIMEYFVQQDRISYRIFQKYPFKVTSYLSLIARTASLLAILSNVVDFRSR